MKKELAQFSRFVLVGILNTAVDLGVLNFLFLLFGFSGRGSYPLFKAASFMTAVIFSYFANRRFVFPLRAPEQARFPAKREGLLFFAVSIIGFFINVLASSWAFYLLSSRIGISPKVSANAGALFGTFLVMLWNFAGYKFLVFKR